MKTTGLTKRVDDLGRVVIPKATRDILKIKEGDPFEVLYDEQLGRVIFQKLKMEEKKNENN